MFGRKKYRKGKTYMYMVCGTKRQAPYLSSSFMSSGSLTLNRDMDACEMRDEVLFHVRGVQGINETDDAGNYAFDFYYVESM